MWQQSKTLQTKNAGLDLRATKYTCFSLHEDDKFTFNQSKYTLVYALKSWKLVIFDRQQMPHLLFIKGTGVVIINNHKINEHRTKRVAVICTCICNSVISTWAHSESPLYSYPHFSASWTKPQYAVWFLVSTTDNIFVLIRQYLVPEIVALHTRIDCKMLHSLSLNLRSRHSLCRLLK